MNPNSRLFPFLVACILSGCATVNPVSSYYQDSTNGLQPEQLNAFFEPAAPDPQIITSVNFETDITNLMKEGYWVLGQSSFLWSDTPTSNQLVEKAQEIGADIILYNSEYSHTESGVRTMVGVTPGSSTTVTASGYASANVSGSVTANAYGPGGYAYGTGNYTGYASGTSYNTETVTTPPQYYTYNVPYSATVNQYQVTFLRKGKPPVLGVRTIPIPDEIRGQLGRNTGCYIWLVENDTPAFRGNILPGDVIVGVGDHDIVTVDDLSYVLSENTGKEVSIHIIRQGQEITLAALLNDRVAGRDDFQTTDNESRSIFKAEGETYLAENAKKEGVKITESGLQYKVLTEGTGPLPAKTDMVKVHYTGTFIDGKKFDSSVDRGEPATFGVDQVIPGWTEALQLMKVGSKWQLAIPSALAYGPEGRGAQMPPNAVLLFDVELLEIVKPEAAAKQ